MSWRRRERTTTNPSRIEVNTRAIPRLPPDGWKLHSLTEKIPISLVGAVPKDYLSYGAPRSSTAVGYIAKKGRLKAAARECVTEEIISKIGAMLPVKMARSKLVRLSKYDVRFLSRNFVTPGRQQLLHGIELVARYFAVEPSEVEATFDLQKKSAEHEFYTVENMLTILESLYPDTAQSLEEGFAKMLAFDAFIGAPDRHAMNWGVLISSEENSSPVRFTPLFDTARGLFREVSDDDLRKKIALQGEERFIENYANRSYPIFGVGDGRRRNHFALIAWIMEHHAGRLGRPIRQLLRAVHLPAIERLLQRRFRRIITPLRIGCIMKLLAFRIKHLP